MVIKRLKRYFFKQILTLCWRCNLICVSLDRFSATSFFFHRQFLPSNPCMLIPHCESHCLLSQLFICSSDLYWAILHHANLPTIILIVFLGSTLHVFPNTLCIFSAIMCTFDFYLLALHLRVCRTSVYTYFMLQ